MKDLETPLNVSPIDVRVKRAIREQFWPSANLPLYQHNNLDWDPYFKYYEAQCQVALFDRGRSVMAKTHQDILDLIRLFEEGVDRGSIKEGLRMKLSDPGRSNQDEVIDGAIDLAARLYQMVNIAVDTRSISTHTRVQWETGTLKACLNSHFSEQQILSDSGLRLEPAFTAANVENIAGIRIVPTDNLADHLRLMEGDGRVAVFCDVSFLKRNSGTVLPDGLVAETLRTISLLFPLGDKATKKWLGKHSNPQGLDMALSTCGRLKLDDRQFVRFRFWHDRLVMLKQAFDQSRPSTISQWWYDRRNGVQWYTFWVAVVVLFLTIFFGLVQSIEGALQVYKAFNPS